MVARVIERQASGALLVELECDAGTLTLTTDDEATSLGGLPFTPSPEAWLALSEATQEFAGVVVD